MIDLKKINFRQPKYIFPLVVAVPAACLLYFIGGIVGEFSSEPEMPSDFLNTELPEPRLKEVNSKAKEMDKRFEILEDGVTAINQIGKEQQSKELLDDDGYSEEELDQILNETEQQRMQREQIEEAQRKIKEAQERYIIRNNDNQSTSQSSDYDPFKELDERQRQRNEELRAILKEPDYEEKQRMERERLAREERERLAKENEPSAVIKADNLVHSKFNTVAASDNSNLDAPLIKAMIDQTTKSTDGTRLRFKLLDDIVIENYKIKKGAYLYGTVSGFGKQRVMANITSILVGDQFLKVNLSVFDLDGMEGFYVPESSFREMMKNAASSVAGQSIQFSNNTSTSSGFDAENVALQAIQNVYQSIASAVSGNLRKNKAKIKYNTIVYLINSK